MSEHPEALSAERLRMALGERAFQFLETTSSTNDVAQRWAANGAPHGAVVVAEFQTEGRGRFGRRWQAPSGTALLFSVVLYLAHLSILPVRYGMAAAVSVRSALIELLGLDPSVVKLKWPNDIQLHGRKVCGILLEPLWRGASLEAIIVGVGINVRVPLDELGLRAIATNLEPYCRAPIDRALLLADILKRLDFWSENAESSALFQTWRAALNMLGKRVQAADATTGQQIVAGQALDVGEDGALLVRTDDGQIHRVFAGEVTLQGPKVE
ncbi:MAG: biotin--[acetyl-CoA-carboxylase] ligase [Chloroflexi bacterium]|nr:biotin--[acetyl-CoA-carboxylase] ligase [Chloroflexota bacterium]